MMRKYGVNWPLFWLGYLIMMSGLVFWANQIATITFPTKPDERVMPRELFFAFVLIPKIRAVFTTTRDKARARIRDAAAGVTPKETNVTMSRWAYSHTMFKLISILVGVMTVAAHLYTGKLSVPVIIAYTIGVPLCFAFGAFLMEKAEEPEAARAEGNRNVVAQPQEVEAAPSAAASHSLDTPEQSTANEQPLLTARGR